MFEGYDTDKHGYHEYGKFYEELLGSRRETVTVVLELGIFQGGSLRAWRDYFPNASIVGLDIDPQTMVHGEPRIRTFTGNVRNREDLLQCVRTYEEFAATNTVGFIDLIVDDASHLPIDQFHALKVLWRYVKPGGFYCIEDLDLNRQGSEILTTCHLIVRETCRDIRLYLGDDAPADDILCLEKT